MKSRSNGNVEYRRGARSACANRQYYFGTGVGYWEGTFTLRITDWRTFRDARLGVRNRLFVYVLTTVIRLFGPARIASWLDGNPDEGEAGVVTNEVKIEKWGVPLYRLRERYHLHSDCHNVTVRARERLGPIPHLFTVRKHHPAEVVDGGRTAIYYLPLLGADWVGRYTVSEDGDHIDSTLTCAWATAREVIHRVE